MREAKGDARVLPECQQGTMEESTWADSMDSVCEGGAECACSDRTDANVEHGEQRNVRAPCAFAHVSFVRLAECRLLNIGCEYKSMAVKCKSLLLSHDRRPRTRLSFYHQGSAVGAASKPHRRPIGAAGACEPPTC